MKDRLASLLYGTPVIGRVASSHRGLRRGRAGAALAVVSVILLLLPAINPGLATRRASSRKSIQSSHNDSHNIRPQATGDLDPSFGNQGIVQVSVSDNGTTPKSIAVQSDGKIVAGGQYGTAASGSSTVIQHSFLFRLNTDGTLDSSFGKSGIATFNLNPGGDGIKAIKVQSDGNILFCGYVANSAGGTDFMVGRATTTGSIDTSFGTNGFANHSGGQALCIDLAINGEIVAGGTTGGKQGDVLVLDSTGSPDPDYPHTTLVGNVSGLSSVTAVLWQFNAGGEGPFGPRIPGQIIVTGLTASGDVGIGELSQSIDGTPGSGPAVLNTAPGPVSLSVIGGANGEVAWAFSGAFLAFSGNTNSVASVSLSDANSLKNLTNPAFLSNPNGGLQVQTIKVYNGPQGVDSGGTVFEDGDVLLGGAITSSDGTSSVGALGVLDASLNFTDGTSALIQYPQFAVITALAPFSTDANIGVYLAGMGTHTSATKTGVIPAQQNDTGIITRNQVTPACEPALHFEGFTANQQFLTAFLPVGEVGQSYQQSVSVTSGGAPLAGALATYQVKGNLPLGMSIDSEGRLVGTPQESGTFTFTIVVRDDSSGCTAKETATLTVRGPNTSYINGVSADGPNLIVAGRNLLRNVETGKATTGKILINKKGQNTKPGPTGADTSLNGKRSAKFIEVGKTITIQVQLGDTSFTNSMVVTRIGE